MKCNRCGIDSKKLPTRRYPKMVGFELEDGTQINFCRACMSEFERAIIEGKSSEFLDTVKGIKHE